MAQGAAKKSSNPHASLKKSKRPSANGLGPKRGARVIAPKKQKLIAKQKLLKKHTAGLTALTERTLAEKAGHLELLAGGKKGRKDEKKQQKQQQQKKAGTGVGAGPDQGGGGGK